ncbi:DUF1822 family protein [bacterium]|nr:DUF1822 family protein [bacterium]
MHQSSQKCEIPEEVWADRIGYVVIQIDAPYQKGYILGFVESVSVPELPLSYLQPFNRLIERFLERSSQPTVQLKQWLQRMFEPDWQPSEDILNAIKGSASRFSQLQPYRTDASLNSVQRRIEQLYRHRFPSQEQSVSIPLNLQEALIQLIQTTQNDEIRWQSAELLWELDPHHPNCPVISARDLGFYLVGYSIALMVGILPKSEDKMLVLLRVYPLGKLAHLPAKLKFTGLDDAGNPFFEVESRQQDDYIQFKFTGDVGDRFSICISLHEVNFTESFVI